MAEVNHVYLNGAIIPESEAKVDTYDRGLLYADGLIETLPLIDGRPGLYARHVNRLADSALFLGIPVPEANLEKAIIELARANGIENGAARITLTRGSLPKGPRPATPEQRGHPDPTLIIQTRPLYPLHEEARRKGVALYTLPWPMRARGLPLQSHKTLAWVGGVLAIGAVEPGGEPLFETNEGHISEGATSNVFWAEDDELYTPGLETGCLPGVVRGLVIELARSRGVNVIEGEFDRLQLQRCDEAFITNSLHGVAVAASIDGHPLGKTPPGVGGELTSLLQNAYLDYLADDLAARKR